MIAAGGIGPLPALLLGVSQRPCGVFVGIVRSSILREQPAGLYRQGNFGYGGDREGGMQGRPAASIRPAEPASYISPVGAGGSGIAQNLRSYRTPTTYPIPALSP